MEKLFLLQLLPYNHFKLKPILHFSKSTQSALLKMKKLDEIEARKAVFIDKNYT